MHQPFSASLSPRNEIIRQQSDMTAEIKTELVRKAIHFFIAFVPLLTELCGLTCTMILLVCGIAFYLATEYARLKGKKILFITRLTVLSMRNRDQGKLVLGPVTLALGAMLALLLFPQPSSSIAIYALAFGDGASSLIGKLYGRIRLPFSTGKTLEGSLACFVAVFISAGIVLNFGLLQALAIALAATILEALPAKDMDNIVVPAGAGLVAAIATMPL